MDENISTVTAEFPWVTVPMETTAQKLKVFALTSNPELLKDHDDEIIDVIGWIVEQGYRARTDGQDSCINTTLFSADGHAYFTQSNGVANAMQRLRPIFPNGPDGILKLKSSKVAMKNGNTVRTLIPVFED